MAVSLGNEFVILEEIVDPDHFQGQRRIKLGTVANNQWHSSDDAVGIGLLVHAAISLGCILQNLDIAGVAGHIRHRYPPRQAGANVHDRGRQLIVGSVGLLGEINRQDDVDTPVHNVREVPIRINLWLDHFQGLNKFTT